MSKAKAATISTTNGINTAVTKAEATRLCNAVQVYVTATGKAKASLADKMLNLLREVAQHGDMASFNAKFTTLCKLTCQRQEWVDEAGEALHTSADALFKKGFEEPYGANVILWIRRVVSHPDAQFRAQALENSRSLHLGYKTMCQEAKEATDAQAKPDDEQVSSKEPTEDEVEELLGSKEPVVSAVKQQAIDMILTLDDSQASAVVRTLNQIINQ